MSLVVTDVQVNGSPGRRMLKITLEDWPNAKDETSIDMIPEVFYSDLRRWILSRQVNLEESDEHS